MKFLPLIWKNIWRRKFRTTFTLLVIFVSFVLFGLLMTGAVRQLPVPVTLAALRGAPALPSR